MTEELNYKEIADNIKDWFEKKHIGLHVSDIKFSRHFPFRGDLTESYEIHLSLEKGDKFLSFSDIPYMFKSNKSFEHAFKKAKIMIGAYFKCIEIDEDK